MKRIVYILLLSLITTGCPIDYWYGMHIYNNSIQEELYCILDRNPGDNVVSLACKIDKLYPPGRYKVFGEDYNWQKNVKDSIAIYFVDANMVELKYGSMNPPTKEEIEKITPESILAEYRFSAEEIKRLDWTINFPPNERLKTIWMRPSYDSLQQYRKE